MKAIILAAGRDITLYPYTRYIPTCLLNIGGKTILEHQINCTRNCRINEMIIVVGFGLEKVENFLRNYGGSGMKIKTLHNPFYQNTSSLISLWIARGEMNEDTVIDGDNLFEIEVLKRTLRVRDEKTCLCVKREPIYQRENTNVLIIRGRVVRIGENLTTPSAKSVGISVHRGTDVELLKRGGDTHRGCREKALYFCNTETHWERTQCKIR
mgnify:CR=1 FL=1